ncbi:MAG: hypothetical protein OCC46_06720 [Pseudodesulfovibrio sp.]
MERLKLLIAEDIPATVKLFEKGIGDDLFESSNIYFPIKTKGLVEGGLFCVF